MAVGGFAKCMDYIGASRALVNISIKPINKLNSPYLILAVSYLIGQLLNVFIPSASGIGVLLMVTMYPILVSTGVSPLSATAVIGTTACLDLGPASGNANLAATTGGLDVSIYFTKYQIPVAIAVSLSIAITHFFTQRYYDRKENFIHDVIDESTDFKDDSEKNVPKIYAIGVDISI